LNLIEKINLVEDEKRTAKLEREEARIAHFETKGQEKDIKKRKRQKLREKSLVQAKQKHSNKVEEVVQNVPSPPKKRSVTFGDTVHVKEFVASPKLKKKNLPLQSRPRHPL